MRKLFNKVLVYLLTVHIVLSPIASTFGVNAQTDTGEIIPESSVSHNIEVCYLTLDSVGEIIEDIPEGINFYLPLYQNPVLSEDSNLPAEYGTDVVSSSFSLSNSLNTKLLDTSDSEDSYCQTYTLVQDSDFENISYAYGQVQITGDSLDWKSALYHDGHNSVFNNLTDAVSYTDNLFTGINIDERNTLSDGHIQFGKNENITRRLVIVNQQKTPTLQPSGLQVCFVTQDANGHFINGSELPNDTIFSIDIFSDAETQNSIPLSNNSGMKETVSIATPFENNSDVFSNGGNTGYCQNLENISSNNHYTYTPARIISGSEFEVSKYSDEHTEIVTSPNMFYDYSYNLFDNNPATNDARNMNADGHMVINGETNRRIIVLNKIYKPTLNLDLKIVDTESSVVEYTNNIGGLKYKLELLESESSPKAIRQSRDGFNWELVSELPTSNDCYEITNTNNVKEIVSECSVWDGTTIQFDYFLDKSTAEGRHYQYLEVADINGNVTVVNTSFIYDITPPDDDGFLLIGKSNTDFSNPSTTDSSTNYVLYQIEDNPNPVSLPGETFGTSFYSGVDSLRFSTDGVSYTTWQEYENDAFETFVQDWGIPQEGNVLEIYMQTRDRAGNIGTYLFRDIITYTKSEPQVQLDLVSTESVSSSTCSGERFTDVCPGDTFYDYISNLANDGIVSGFPDNTFRPGEPVTRAQMAKFIKNAFNVPTNTSCSPFPDVNPGNVFSEFITTLKCSGIINGYGDGRYGPEDLVTRGQATKFIVEAIEFKYKVSLELIVDTNVSSPFNDLSTNNTFYNYIIILEKLGAINGYLDNTFRSELDINRGQMSKIVDISRRYSAYPDLIAISAVENRYDNIERDGIIHEWCGYTVQDYNNIGPYGDSIIFYNSNLNQAFLVTGEIWEHYYSNGGCNEFGLPTGNMWSPDTPCGTDGQSQYFEEWQVFYSRHKTTSISTTTELWGEFNTRGNLETLGYPVETFDDGIEDELNARFPDVDGLTEGAPDGDWIDGAIFERGIIGIDDDWPSANDLLTEVGQCPDVTEFIEDDLFLISITDLLNENVCITTEVGRDEDGFQNDTLENLIENNILSDEVITGINGDFWDAEGNPLGYNMQNGIDFSGINREISTSIAFSNDNKVDIGIGTREQEEYNWNVVGGGPRIITNGQISDVCTAGRLNCNDLNARSAAGVTDQGRLVLIINTGWRNMFSDGVTVEQLVNRMLELNVTEATMLDSGPSSTILFNGEYVSSRGRLGQREIITGLGVYQSTQCN